MICRKRLANACLQYERVRSVSIEEEEHTKKTMPKSKPAAIRTANRNSQPDVIESRAVPSVASINEFQMRLQRSFNVHQMDSDKEGPRSKVRNCLTV